MVGYNMQTAVDIQRHVIVIHEVTIGVMAAQERGQTLPRYRCSACPHCSTKPQCTPYPYRRVTRGEHEAVLEAVQVWLDRA